MESQEKYQELRHNLMYQLALGIVLFRHQVSQGMHFHWEQPARSLMLQFPGMAEVYQYTQTCQFDMCNAGDLKDPSNGMPMKKGMNVVTTSKTIYLLLHGRVCRGNHSHQSIAGSFTTPQGTVLRSRYTEVYPRKFAREVARAMMHNHRDRPFNWQVAFSHMCQETDAEIHVLTKFRQKTKFVRSELITPSSRDDHVKRRRLGKQSEDHHLEDYQNLMTEINQIIRRVGKSVIQEPNILEKLQQMFHDQKIIHVIACRGIDRTLGPPKGMHPEEAPLRKSFILERGTGTIKYEKDWEKWVHLANRQLIRPAHACRINVTMFAKPWPVENDSSQSSQDVNPMPPMPEPASEQPAPSQTESGHADPVTATPLTSDNVPISHEAEVPENNPEGIQDNNSNPTSTSHADNRTHAVMPGERPIRQTGPNFRALPRWEQRMIIQMHKNLGHPSNDRLSRALQVAGYRPEIVHASQELECSTCSARSPPKHQRPAILKPIREFNSRIYVDGIKWTNSQGQSFHFYHIIDAGSNFHVAITSPSRETEHVIQLLTRHWISWAGPPNEIMVDSGTELNSEQFAAFLQRFNIKGETTCPGAHWQNCKIERHGQFLQAMLTRMDTESHITSYEELQLALSQCTHAKNCLSVHHGYAPEVIVFGRHSRVPGSVVSDESLPSHSQVTQEDDTITPNMFREMLQVRERARRAYHAADNCDALRRAMLRRPCPQRGVFQKGQWVMIWQHNPNSNPQWIGPQRVVLQDDNHTVWTTQCGRLYRRAPEHVRGALSEEGTPGPDTEIQWTNLEQQIHNMSRNFTNNNQDELPIPHHENNPEHLNEETASGREEPDEVPDRMVSHESISQPESEQENSNELPESDATSDTMYLISEDPADSLVVSADCPLAWRCEVDVKLDRPLEQRQPTNEEAWTFLATSAKKQRSEIRLSELSPSERKEFDQAKDKEIQNWIQTGTLTKVFRHEIPQEQILKCRWILTWKPLDNVDQPEAASTNNPSSRTHKAKARLVVLGYLDPKIEEIPRDSPTLNKTSRMMIFQTVSSFGWTLQSFDIKAAFLQGQPQSDRITAIDPVPEMRRALNMLPSEVGKLNKSAYGLIDAPYLWYCSLVSELQKLNFEACPFDPCVFVLREKDGSLAGVLGIHVDDGVGGGNSYYQQQIDKLEQKYAFGSKKSTAFTFTGIEITQQPDNSIHLSQANYIKQIKPINIPSDRKLQPDQNVTEPERLALRGVIGSLQYAAVNTRPDIASKLSFLQSSINSAKVENLQEANKLLHEAKKHHHVNIVIKPIAPKDFRLMAFSDASFSSHKKPDSHAGVIIVGTHKNISKNHQCPISPLSWGCRKIQRVVTSTLSAETTAMAAALDQLAWLRLFWAWLMDPNVQWRRPEEALSKLEPAISAPTIQEQCDLAITDCKSLFDLI